MNREEFLNNVAERAELSQEQAETVTRAVLATLAERISGGEARDLAAQLPVPLGNPLLPAAEEAESFGLDEFVRRVAERAGISRGEADRAVAAVLDTLRDAVTPGEFDHVLSQLPEEFKRLGVPAVRARGDDVS